jgi:hypothetical protein
MRRQVLAGDALLAVRLLVQVAELLLEHAVDAARPSASPQLDEVLAVLAAQLRAAVLTRGVGRRSIGHFIVSHLAPLRKSFIFSRRQRRQTGPV